jgi:hypothetical protein
MSADVEAVVQPGVQANDKGGGLNDQFTSPGGKALLDAFPDSTLLATIMLEAPPVRVEGTNMSALAGPAWIKSNSAATMIAKTLFFTQISWVNAPH